MESPLEQVTNEEDASVGAIPSVPKKAAEAAPGQNVYELSRATTRALIAFDRPLRDRLICEQKINGATPLGIY